MRVRDLRSQLMKLGLGNDEVMKMLDKTELESTLARLTQHKATMETYNKMESWWKEQFMWLLAQVYENIYSLIIGGAVFLFLFVIPADYVTGLRQFVYDYVTGYIFPLKSKVKALKKAWKHRLYYSFCCLLLALAIEMYEMSIHLCMPLRFMLPTSSPVRNFFPPTFYIPLSIDMIKKDLPSYGMNVGPQITVMACRYLRGKFENLGAKDLVEHREQRRSRRSGGQQ